MNVPKPVNNLSHTDHPELAAPDRDVAELPTQGLFYSHGKGAIAFEYMTGEDEDIIMAGENGISNAQFDALLRLKIKDPDFKVEELYGGDWDRLLLNLRITAYGHEYKVTVIDPETIKPFETVVDLTKLKNKEMTIKPNENGHFECKLPTSKHDVVFRLLTRHEERESNAQSEARYQKFGGANHTVTDLIKRKIVSINGKTDSHFISSYVKLMKVSDKRWLLQYMMKVEPTIDRTYEFTAPSGARFHSNVPWTGELFLPQYDV